MRAVIQRVLNASVSVDQKEVSRINKGLLILLGVDITDSEDDLLWLVQKIAGLRIFSDHDDKMNLSVRDIDGEVLVVSQFTLFGAAKKGNRPSFLRAAKPDKGEKDYLKFVDELQELIEKPIQKGVFGADMKVDLCNDGPVTLIIDTKNKE